MWNLYFSYTFFQCAPPCFFAGFSIHIQMNSNYDCDNQAKDVRVPIV